MVEESPTNPDYMRAYLTEETIAKIGKYTFGVKMIAKGGNSESIGPFTISIVQDEIPLVFPSNLINPKEGLSKIEVNQPYKVESFLIVPEFNPPFMTYDEAAAVLLFDTRSTHNAKYIIIIKFNGPYADKPVIR